jgi:sterol desaturase/sphingolipid hydroxylase (fatty acid hydroxylase superfamily)
MRGQMDWVALESTAFTVAFVGSFIILAIWESLRPWCTLTGSTERRWMKHGILFAVSVVLQSVAIRTSPLLVAQTVAGKPWALLNGSWLPWPVQFAIALLLLDFVHYATHRLLHAFRVGWRIHEIHHSDTDYDISISVRFHPLEVAGNRVLYLAAIAVLAPPLAAVFVSEVLSTLINALVHANIELPQRLERALRLAFITPELHRIHHSSDVGEQNSNFGQTLVWWDRLFGTYQGSARLNSAEFTTGVANLPPGSDAGVWSLLAAPFRRRGPEQSGAQP